MPRLFVERAAGAQRELEDGSGAEHSWIQEFEQAPELPKMVLDRRAAQRETMVRVQKPGRFRGYRRLVLDRLRLVENHIVEAHVLEARGVLAQRAVGRNQQSVFVEVLGALAPLMPGVIEHAQPRRESSRLLLPIEDERFRHHDERGTPAWMLLACGAARFEQGQYLHRLAQPHVVGQAAAETELAKEVEPTEAFSLIGTQLSLKASRRIGRTDAVELRECIARSREHLIDVRFRLRGEQRIEHGDLRAAEAQMIAVCGAETRENPVLRQPFFGQQAERTIVELDERFAFSRGFEQLGKLRVRIAELDGAVKLEPIDARSDLELEATGRAIELAERFDAPSVGQELVHDPRQARGGKFESRVGFVAARELAQAEREKALSSGLLVGAIAPKRTTISLKYNRARM